MNAKLVIILTLSAACVFAQNTNITTTTAEIPKTTNATVPPITTTTTAPITTKVTTTTVAPKTTTSAATTTAAPKTTTTVAPVTTTAKPKPEESDIVEYNITATSENKTYNCFMAKMKTKFTITYKLDKVEKKDFFIFNSSTVNKAKSVCGVNMTTLVIDLNNLSTENATLSLIFNNDKNQTYTLSDVVLNLDPKLIADVLINASDSNMIHSNISNAELYVVPFAKSYKCMTPIAKDMTDVNKYYNVTISLADVQIDAFRSNKTGVAFRDAQECDSDDEFDDKVPIVVGLSLLALIIIVLIAYFIGRKRSRQNSYQSV